MEQIKLFLDQNYFRKELSLPMIAEKYYINSSYLSRTFSKRYGITLIEYLNKIRIEHACHYLEDGSWIAVRPSGTEPKCKFYFCVKGADKADVKAKTVAYHEAAKEWSK